MKHFTGIFGFVITGYFAVVFTIAAVLAYVIWMTLVIPYHTLSIVYRTIRYGHFALHVKKSAVALRIKF